MPFTKGQSGNPGGRPKARPFAEALRMEIKAGGEDHPALRKIARALIAKAADGDLQAIRELADRLDGKVGQSVVEEGPITILVKTGIPDRNLSGENDPPLLEGKSDPLDDEIFDFDDEDHKTVA